MYYTTTAALHTTLDSRVPAEWQEDEQEFFDSEFPGWEVREAYGERFLSESDFPVDSAEADAGFPTNEEWEWFLSESYVDPAER